MILVGPYLWYPVANQDSVFFNTTSDPDCIHLYISRTDGIKRVKQWPRFEDLT